jgi:hypothetical protein
MWFTLLAPLLTGIFGKDGIIGTYITTKQQIQQKEQDAKLQLAIANIELIKQQGIDEVDREKLRVANAAPAWFKLISYIMINYPLILVFISDEKGKAAFKTIESIPMWYAMLYVGVVSVIWGLPVASNWMSNVFNAMQQAWAVRQDKKIDVISAKGNAESLNLEQAKKQIFDIMRKTTGTLSQPQVDAANPIIDQAFNLAQQALSNNQTSVNTGDK